MFYSSRDLVMSVIEVFRDLPCLWKANDPYYRDKHTRNLALEELVEVFRKYEPNATKSLVTKKLNSLRGSFRKELNKVRASEEEGQIHVPKLWYYEHLLFLVDQEASTTTKSLFDEMHIIYEAEGDDETESDEEISSPTNSLPCPESLKRSRCEEASDSNEENSNPSPKRTASNDIYAGVDCIEGDVFFGIETNKDSERSNDEFARNDPSKISISKNQNPAVVYLEGEKTDDPSSKRSFPDKTLEAVKKGKGRPFKRPYRKRMSFGKRPVDQKGMDPPANTSLVNQENTSGCSENQPMEKRSAHCEKFGSFGEHVTERLREMPPEMVPYCQKLICDAIFYAEMRSLNITSRIVTEYGPSGPSSGRPEHYQALLPNVSCSTTRKFKNR